jgi:uroporphyrinogen-III decarboxylase
MMTSCLGNPTFVHELIDVFHQPFIDITRMALEHGAEVIYCSAFYESIGSGWSPSTHRKFFLPRIKEHVELSHSYGAVYHLYDDGKVRETLPMMKDIGVDLISTVCPRPAGKWGRYTEVND